MTVNLSLNSKQHKINYSSNNNQNRNNTLNRAQTFKGFGDLVTNALVMSDKSPMIGVSIIDLFSMIGPRTIVDATRNGFAATETFLRESAGLIINCLAPGLVVFGMAKLLEKPIMGKDFRDTGVSKFWSNQKTNNLLTSAWLDTNNEKNITKRVSAYVERVLDNIEGLAGKNDWRKIKDLPNRNSLYSSFTNAILNNDEKLLTTTTDNLIKDLGASRNIRLLNNTPSPLLSNAKNLDVDSKLKDLLKEMSNLGKTYSKMSDNAVIDFSKRMTKLINAKSAAGLAIIIAAGASFQYFNRMLTKYRTGSDGFVGDADYVEQLKAGKVHSKKEYCEKENKKLIRHKILGTLGMGLLAVASFGKIPTANMFQFNGIFPTMNQCRAISAVTYSGRILSSANDNELKETAFRDTLTFINLYYLGDYVSKLFATLTEKYGKGMKGQLLNETCAISKDANIFQKFWHWFRHTEIKGFEELANNPTVRKNRAFAQASGLIYSCIVLGLLVPIYNKHRTNKKAKELKLQQEANSQNNINKVNKSEEMYQKNIFSNFINNGQRS